MSDERRPRGARANFSQNFRSNSDRRSRGGHASGDRRRDRREDTWYDASCYDCGAAFRVPFEPTPDRQLFCKECRETRRANGTLPEPPAREGREGREGREPREGRSYDIVCSHCGKADVVPFRPHDGSIVLCRDCMSNPNVERIGGKIYHTVICATCGKETKVPFKPDAGSRVLCRECHNEERDQKQRSREYFAKNHPSVVHNTKVHIEIRCEKCGHVDVLPFMPKTHGMILCRQCAEETFGDAWARRNRVGAREYPFTCARCAAQDFVPFKPKEGQELLCRHCLDNQAVLKHHRNEMSRFDGGICIRKNDEE